MAYREVYAGFTGMRIRSTGLNRAFIRELGVSPSAWIRKNEPSA